jgi:hypothetical protein
VTASDASLPQGQALLDAVGTAFARLRRHTMQAPIDSPVGRKDLKRNLVLNIVDEAAKAGTEMTIGGLADHLLVDPSVASRMVLQLTAEGTALLACRSPTGRRGDRRG